MSREPSESERVGNEPDRDANGEAEPAVRERLEEIRRAKHSRVRWGVSRHTAERALLAISESAPRAPYHASGKCRRRKRHKRLL